MKPSSLNILLPRSVAVAALIAVSGAFTTVNPAKAAPAPTPAPVRQLECSCDEPLTWDVYLLFLLRLLHELFGGVSDLSDNPNTAMSTVTAEYLEYGFPSGLTQQQRQAGADAIDDLIPVLQGTLPGYVNPQIAADLLELLPAMRDELLPPN